MRAPLFSSRAAHRGGNNHPEERSSRSKLAGRSDLGMQRHLVTLFFVFPQLEEDISEHLRWSINLKSILNAGKSEFQAYELVDTYQFGKVRSIGGVSQLYWVQT